MHEETISTFYGRPEMLFVVVQKPENAREKVSYCVKSVVKKGKLSQREYFSIFMIFIYVIISELIK